MGIMFVQNLTDSSVYVTIDERHVEPKNKEGDRPFAYNVIFSKKPLDADPHFAEKLLDAQMTWRVNRLNEPYGLTFDDYVSTKTLRIAWTFKQDEHSFYRLTIGYYAVLN